ncbi:MAG: indole-3-glycerol phosphate synthase TrpC [Chloroflexi bacterium]|nr:indole-3-glycerol phosphate synthase TrpC [Chloroflexota bacterium]
MGKKTRLQRIRARGKLLDEILAWKRQEVARLKRERPLAELRALALTVPAPLDFLAALRSPHVGLIAEVVRATPARGLLSSDFDPAALARTYATNRAAAISVVTDARFFQGSLEHLARAKETVNRLDTPVPIVRRDFIFDPYQVWESRVAGADAVHLIAAVVGEKGLRTLLSEARALGMDALVEVHTEEELARALAAGARAIDLSNRDLGTFRVEANVVERLRPLVPPDVLVVGEGGIHTPEDARQLAALGVDAVLVGEPFVRAKGKERARLVRAFVEALEAKTR